MSGALFFSTSALAADLTTKFDVRHKACLESIADDAQQAYEIALQWRSEGGGRRAKHCVAMALFALGHEDEAAYRLDALAAGPDGGAVDTRVKHYSEAANFWLTANEAEKAYASASAGLKLKYDHLDLRIARARAYALSGRYDYAETDLTSVLTLDPSHASALRYRADARFKLDKFNDAHMDIEAALKLDPTSVETALLRGQIREAIRMAEVETE
jgi:tetratricopeptide (TPR) repeat protein